MMKTTITAKNMIVSEAITKRVNLKTSKMERYLGSEVEIFVHVSKSKNGRRVCEITVPFDGAIIRAEAAHEDNLFICIDQALAKLERQIHKHRTKLGKRVRSDAFQNMELEFLSDVPQEETQAPQVVRYKQFPVRPMSIEDAILQMELLGHAFFVFVNLETERTNILYLRKDGDLGLMEPEA